MKTALIIIYALVMAVFFVFQGTHILKTGIVAAFFTRQPPSARLTWSSRLSYAATYLVAGLGIVVLLLTALAKQHLTFARVVSWIGEHASELVVLCVMAGLGVCFLVRPAILIRWAKQAHPQLSEGDPFVLGIARLIGAGYILFSTVIFARFFGN